MSEAPALPEWDLSDLYASLDDPRIQQDMDRLKERAAVFAEWCRGRIAAPDCTAALLREALDAYEAINRDRTRPLAYASLMFSADTSDPKRGALLQKLQVESTAVSSHLIFFDLEIGQMPEDTFRRVIEDPGLEKYRHYLEHERLTSRHNLTEPEEKIADELSNTGVRAFLRLFSELTSRARFRITLGGEEREVTQPELLALLYDPDRNHRALAFSTFTQWLKQNEHVLGFIYNNLLQEKATTDRLRRYDYPAQARNESNELSPEIVRAVVEAVVEGFPLVAEYYRLKRRLLGLDELTHLDRYAPVGEVQQEIPFPDARSTVLDSFGDFSGAVREVTEPFFADRWIDAAPRPGKRGGAFCSYVTPQDHPYVFMNYTGRARDVMTLAHELGHGVHGMLARRNHYLDFYPSLPLAETASVFGEMLVFERLQQQIEDPTERLALLCGKIEDTFATVFRQVSMYRFEEAAHELRRAEGELTPQRYDELWQRMMQEMFGDALVLGEEHAVWWRYIPHIYGTPFYVYAYAFGELLVLSLYARYRKEGEPFVARYLELLAAGGSRAPEALLSDLGIDIRKKEFWQGGIHLIRDMVQQAVRLAAPQGN